MVNNINLGTNSPFSQFTDKTFCEVGLRFCHFKNSGGGNAVKLNYFVQLFVSTRGGNI